MPRFSKARRLRRFRVLSAGIAASEIVERFSDGLVGDPTTLSTLKSPLALANMLDDSVTVVLEEAVALADSTWAGTAVFPRMVRKASLGVDNLKRPETCVSFWMDLTRS
jgi:hypothetical protein